MTIVSILVGLLAGIMLVLRPKVAIWTLLIVALGVAGPIQYFLPQFHQVKWAVTVLSGTLLIAALLYAVAAKPGKPPVFVYMLGVLLVSVVITFILNQNVHEFVIAGKNFFQFWSIPLVMFCMIKTPKEADNLFKGVAIIGAVQPPVAVLQYLFFSKAGGAFAGDSVAGTFGGAMRSGGPNAGLSIFMCLLIAYVIIVWLNRRISFLKATALCIWFIIPILLANAKSVVIFFAVSFLLVFLRQFRRRPMLTLVASGLFAVMVAGISLFYFSEVDKYAHNKRYMPRTFSEYIDQTIGYNFATDYRELTRFSAILFWFREHSLNRDFGKSLFGHGLGATKDSGTIVGHLVSSGKYRGMGLSITELTGLLWDIGLVGTILFMLIFILAFLTAGRLRRDGRVSGGQSDRLFLAQIACIFFLLSLPYKEMLISNQAFNALSMFFLGYIAYWKRYLASAIEIVDKT